MVTQTTALAPDGQPWQQVTLRNKAGMTVTVADWGATLLSAEVPLATTTFTVTAVPGTTTSGGVIAATGAEVSPVIIMGAVVLVALGVGLVVLSRRKRP